VAGNREKVTLVAPRPRPIPRASDSASGDFAALKPASNLLIDDGKVAWSPIL